MGTRKATTESLLNILDTFAGSDGGVRFVKFRGMIDTLDIQAKSGDESAQKIIDIMHQFSRMIDLAQEGYAPKLDVPSSTPSSTKSGV